MPTRLKEVKRLTQDEAVFTEATARVSAAQESLAALTDPQLITKLDAPFENIDDSPRSDYLRRAQAASGSLAARLTTLATDARTALDAASQEIETTRTEWSDAVREQRDEHGKVLRELVEEGLEPNRYLITTQALEKLKAKESRRSAITKCIQDLQSEREALLQALESHENERARELTRGDPCRELRDWRRRGREACSLTGSGAHQVVDQEFYKRSSQSYHGRNRRGEFLYPCFRRGGASWRVGT